MTTLHAGQPLSAASHREVRRHMIFECCKWDPQVEDVSVLADYPLAISAGEWGELCAATESLARETLAMERELMRRPDLHRSLALPRAIRAALHGAQSHPSAEGPRVMRFDFHPTHEGWRISEVNSDVPGGFIEASALAPLMQLHVGTLQMPEDPTALYADAIRASLREGATVAMVHATAFVDDRQVMLWIARHLDKRGLRPVLVAPDQLRWQQGRAFLKTRWHDGAADLVLRFFPGEWLPALPRECAWQHFFAGSSTPLSNSATALLTQGKRLPLIWDKLGTPTPAWRKWLPETRDPRRAPWRRDDSWVLKPALGRVGEGIAIAGVTKPKDLRTIRRAAFLWPSHFIAQQRFEAIPIQTPHGPRWPCIGIYAINDRAAGAYVRLGRTPHIEGRAEETALLIVPDAASAATAA